MVDQKKRWFYTINPHFFWFEKSGWPEKKIRVWRTTFLEPLFYIFLEKWLQIKWLFVFLSRFWVSTFHFKVLSFMYFSPESSSSVFRFSSIQFASTSIWILSLVEIEIYWNYHNQIYFFLLQVMRLFRLGRVARALHRFLESSFALLFLMLSFYMVVAHWFACVWYVIGMEDLKTGTVKSRV